MPSTVNQALWTETELAEHLRVDVKSVQRWRQEGEGPPVTKVGRGVRYRPEAVDVWLDAHTRA